MLMLMAGVNIIYSCDHLKDAADAQQELGVRGREELVEVTAVIQNHGEGSGLKAQCLLDAAQVPTCTLECQPW